MDRACTENEEGELKQHHAREEKHTWGFGAYGAYRVIQKNKALKRPRAAVAADGGAQVRLGGWRATLWKDVVVANNAAVFTKYSEALRPRRSNLARWGSV
jgi:hypothetical protein